jgi:hypothetical protein
MKSLPLVPSVIGHREKVGAQLAMAQSSLSCAGSDSEGLWL